LDEGARVIADPEHSDGEDRFVLLGVSTALRVLVVCHCYRHADVIRIISARRADRSEQRQYREWLQ
ncbi:MAG TPA: BrnT family toxin, partial [Rhodanobacteraceae bacterium]|nr:BrnT family toxin [Rhodanobacteraceae bacterium]